MSQKLRAKSTMLRSAALRLSLAGALSMAAVAFGNTGCEDKAIGRPCEVLTEATPSQAVYNSQALECPSRICLKPSYQAGSSGTQDTGAYCSASCSQDSDCDGQLRDPTNPLDKRCSSGFTCGIPFVKGRICCQKLCLCKDFLGPAGAPIPIACQGNGAATCHEGE
jgi:hypothetical protein